MAEEKAYYTKNSTGLCIIGWICIAVGLIYLVAALTGAIQDADTSSILFGVIVMLAVCGGGGIFALYKAAAYKKKGKKYDRYVSIIESQMDTSFEAIAAAYPIDYQTAVEDLRTMVSTGFFLKAYLDFDQKELVIPARAALRRQASLAEKAPSEKVICPHCGGANLRIPGTSRKCEYCDSSIPAEEAGMPDTYTP